MSHETIAMNGGVAVADPPGEVRYLSRQQLASRWSVTTRAIAKWERAGKLRATRFGTAVRYPLDQIEAIERAGM